MSDTVQLMFIAGYPPDRRRRRTRRQRKARRALRIAQPVIVRVVERLVSYHPWKIERVVEVFTGCGATTRQLSEAMARTRDLHGLVAS